MIEGGCAALSAAQDEPIAGTASRIRSWLMVEQPGRWGHDALLDSGLPQDVGAVLKARGEAAGVRVLLIQRRGRRPGGPRRCFAAFTGRRERRLAAFEVRDPRELLDLDLPGLVDRRWQGLGTPVPGPLFLVCTHGKHDACCARYGGPVARALAARPDAWECTHVGGDRFAGNLVCFPHGLYFGRLGPTGARRVADAYERGRIVLAHFRGRAAYPPPVQVAEQWLRRETGAEGVDDLTLERRESEGGRHLVVFRTPSGRRSMAVREVLLPERLLTCKATHPHRPHGFEVEEVS